MVFLISIAGQQLKCETFNKNFSIPEVAGVTSAAAGVIGIRVVPALIVLNSGLSRKPRAILPSMIVVDIKLDVKIEATVWTPYMGIRSGVAVIPTTAAIARFAAVKVGVRVPPTERVLPELFARQPSTGLESSPLVNPNRGVRVAT